MPASAPTTASAYADEDAFPGLMFDNAVVVESPPGETNRLFVVERAGLIRVIPDLSAPTTEDFLDIRPWVSSAAYAEQGCLGLAFHPNFASNGYFYVYYTGPTNTAAGTGDHDILCRFTVSSTNPNRADPASLTPLIAQYDEGLAHNAGCLKFGPDGYLYLSIGDEGSMFYFNNQVVDRDFFGGIFRLDVDGRPGNLPPNPHPAILGSYLVPADNPFLGITQFNGLPINTSTLRTEFYAVGLRNPWRFGFDPFTGELACGDVGETQREEFNFIVPGGNYGFMYKEGTLNSTFPLPAPPGFASLPPDIEFSHDSGPQEFRSVAIIYGLVYRGTRFPELVGKHILGDHNLHHLWAAWRAPSGGMSLDYLGPRAFNVSSMGEDPRNGDLLLVRDYHEPQPMRRLVAAPPGGPNVALPDTLSETGLFADVGALTPAEGVLPYEINVPFWSDRAHKRRWFMPATTSSSFQAESNGLFTFPEGTVWIKHFDLPLVEDDPGSLIRLETRVLVKTATAVYGASYRYGTNTQDAALVSSFGLVEDFEVLSGGSIVTQRWYYPGQADCLRCHNDAAGGALGFQPVQLNRNAPLDAGGQTNQLAWMISAGYIANPEDLSPLDLRLAPVSETELTLEHRARSLLHANCSSCHFPGGPAAAQWDARITTPLEGSGLLSVAGDGSRLIVPGEPGQSPLLARMQSPSARMPPLGSFLVDTGSVAVLSQWITSLSGYQTYAEWAATYWPEPGVPEALASANPDLDSATNYDEYLAQTSPLEPQPGDRLQLVTAGGQPRIEWSRPAGAKTRLECTDRLGAGSEWRPIAAEANRLEPLAVTTRFVQDVSPSGTSRFYRVSTWPR